MSTKVRRCPTDPTINYHGTGDISTTILGRIFMFMFNFVLYPQAYLGWQMGQLPRPSKH